MKKDELIRKLDEKGVPRQSYNLDGLKDGEILCVINDGGWKVVYNSRGRISDSIDCASEKDAYDTLYKEMKDAYGC